MRPDEVPSGTKEASGGTDRSAQLAAMGTAAILVFLVATMQARAPQPSSWEISTFEWVNGRPGWLYIVIWPFMQYGVLVTIPIASGIAWIVGRRRLSALLLSSGIGIYLLAKVIKRLADRGRPDAFLVSVEEREVFARGSLGYTSGHAAVAATIATLSALHLSKPWPRISVALVIVVGVGRMYVGAHLPLDIVGGIALGVAAGTGATLVSDRLSP